MLTNERTIKFHGFHPSDFSRSYLEMKMSEMHDAAPYGANLKATFTRKHAVFKGVVTIYSSAGRFFAVASGRKLKSVTHKLVDQLRKQLEKWKSERFHNESFKGMIINNDTNKEENYDDHIVA